MQGVSHLIARSLERLSTARPAYAAAALLLYAISVVIAGARWRGFLRALGGEVSVVRATLATLGGIAAGNLTPAPGGEACRIGLVRLGGRATWHQATIAAMWDRLSEVPPVLVLTGMALFAVTPLLARWPHAAVVSAAVAIGAGVGAIALWRFRHARGSVAQWRRRLLPQRVSAGLFAAGVGYSSLLWLQDFLRLTCVTLAFNVVLSPTKIATLSIVAMLGGAVPGLAGLGPVEGGLVAGLAAFGVDVPTAAAVTLLERAISYGMSTAAGGIAIAVLGGRSVWRGSRAGFQARESEADAARS